MKVSNLLKKEKGFTLIEIVLVLAIAGLILVIVFLAVSGAQKSRRDTQRKNDNARLLSQVESCASNNSGNYGGACSAAVSYNTGGTYQPSNFKDPTLGTDYTVSVVAALPAACPTPNVYINVNGRIVTTRMCLEQGYQDLTNQ